MGKRSWLDWLGRRDRQLDLQAFRERVAAVILARYPGAVIRRTGHETLEVDLGIGSGEVLLGLDRFHRVYREAPEELDQLIHQLASAAKGETPPVTAESLVVLVRPSTYLTGSGAVGDAQLSRSIAGDLHAVVAVDAVDAIAFPSGAELRDALGWDDASIWARAASNTRGRLPNLDLPEPKTVSLLICEGAEATGALIDDEAWDALAAKAPDGLLVLPAEKNVLCVIGTSSAEVMPALREVLAISEGAPDYLSSIPLVRRDGKWVEAMALDLPFAPGGFKH